MQIGHFSDTNWTKRTLSETNYQTDGSLATSNMSAYSPTNNTQPTLSKCPIKHKNIFLPAFGVDYQRD